MSEFFIKRIKINELRNLRDVEIALSEQERKHLIITGKNGSGKTTLLQEIRNRLSVGWILSAHLRRLSATQSIQSGPALTNEPLDIEFVNEAGLISTIDRENFVTAFFTARRDLKVQQVNSIEKFKLPNQAPIDQKVSDDLLKYLIYLRSMLTDACYSKKNDDVKRLEAWFENFENVLKRIFNDRALKLEYDSQNLTFYLLERGKDKVDFNSLSDGYAAVIRIVTELMMRMENKVAQVYDVQGIALIDEIETHLHIELQKAVLPFLTTFFPRIQFIVTTHSPFILNSIENAVVYDLENKIRIEEPSEISSLALVKNFFMVDSDYSKSIENKINEFEKLTEAGTLTEGEEARLADLLMDLSTLSPTLSPEMYLRFKAAEEKIKEKQA